MSFVFKINIVQTLRIENLKIQVVNRGEKNDTG